MRLPTAFRSSSRPSSPVDAKAFIASISLQSFQNAIIEASYHKYSTLYADVKYQKLTRTVQTPTREDAIGEEPGVDLTLHQDGGIIKNNC